MNTLNFHNTHETLTFQEFLDTLQQITMRHSNLCGGIIKYAHDSETGKDFAITFFESQNNEVGNEAQKWQIDENMIWKALHQFHEEIDLLNTLQQQLQTSELSDGEKTFIHNNITHLINKFKIFQNAIYLEVEKYGFPLSTEKRKYYLEQVNHFQDLVYGMAISENPKETAFVISHLGKLFEAHSSKISEVDQHIFSEFLNAFWYIKKDDIVKNAENIPVLHDNLEVIVDVEMVLPLFQYVVYEIYNLKEWEVIIDENASMFSANTQKRRITIPKKKIENLSLFRLLQLFDHEIGTHAIRGNNMLHTLKVAGANYLDHEEWWALLSEKEFTESVENLSIEPTIHHITTFIAENYPANEAENLIKIYFQLAGIKENPHDRMRRVKRFVSDELPGANRKDVSYTRGNVDIIQKWQEIVQNPVKRREFVKDFYFSKLSLADQEYVDRMRRSMDISDEDIIFPIWIGKMLAKKLQWEQIFLNTRFNENDEQKNFIDEDGRFVVEHISFGVQRKIVKLLQMLRNTQK